MDAFGAPGHGGSNSYIPTEENNSMRSRDNRSTFRSSPRLPRTLEDVKNEKPSEALQEMRRRVVSLENKKELVLLGRKLSQLEAEEAAGFPPEAYPASEKTSAESRIYQQMILESRLTVPGIKTYSGQNYTEYLSFVRACEHVFCTKPTTYRKEVDKVLYGIGALEGIPFKSWYRYEEKFGRSDVDWDAFKTFLLHDLFPPEVYPSDVHKKYRETNQKIGQDVHGLVAYLEELEAQMVPVTEEYQMSILLGALHPWIEAKVSSRPELPKSKLELIQLALGIEASASFRLTETGKRAKKGTSARAWETVDNCDDPRPSKRSRPEDKATESLLGFPARSRSRREDSNLPQTRRDLSKTKCFNCNQLGHISANCNLPPKNIDFSPSLQGGLI